MSAPDAPTTTPRSGAELILNDGPSLALVEVLLLIVSILAASMLLNGEGPQAVLVPVIVAPLTMLALVETFRAHRANVGDIKPTREMATGVLGRIAIYLTIVGTVFLTLGLLSLVTV